MAQKIITYKGKTLTTTHYLEMSDDLFMQLKQQYYEKPKYNSIVSDFSLLLSGGVMNSNITNYYFKDLMAKTRLHHSNWSIEDVFEYKPLLEHFYSKVHSNKKVYAHENLIDNIETSFRLGGKGTASKPSNYPLDSVYEILRRYNVNNNWYDMSCGWGVRLTGALVKNVNYYGTDPNYILVERLNQLTQDWLNSTKTRRFVDIRATGSEVLHYDWINKMGLCFTSPPYFFLEDYKIGNQSYKENMSYESWLTNFMEKTIQNCHKYLVDNGILAININDFKSGNVTYSLFQDTFDIAIKNGFSHIETIRLENIERISEKRELNDNSEQIMVFMKSGYEHLFENKEPIILDIFDFLDEEWLKIEIRLRKRC